MRFSAIAFASVAVVVAVVPSVAAPTDQYDPDPFAVSPNGRYRIDAKSPDNAGPRPTRFPLNYTYTLTDTTTKKVVWERKQPMERDKVSSRPISKEPSPVDIFVDDSGLVVSRTVADTILVFDPSNGRCRGETSILATLPKDQAEAFAMLVPFQAQWEHDAEWYFLHVPATASEPAQALFVVRLHWNHRIVFDTESVKAVDLEGAASAAAIADLKGVSAATQRIMTLAIEEETRRAFATFQRGTAELTGDKWPKAQRSMRAALHTIGFLKCESGEPALRKVEKSLTEVPRLDSIRAKVRESLRKIGATPAQGFGARMNEFRPDGSISPFHRLSALRDSVPVDLRTANAGSVKVGMTVKEVTNLVGFPDAEIHLMGACFDYDIDAPKGYTVRVSIDRATNTVRTIQRIEPFAFLHDALRLRASD